MRTSAPEWLVVKTSKLLALLNELLTLNELDGGEFVNVGRNTIGCVVIMTVLKGFCQ